jgi:hypothetical protein
LFEHVRFVSTSDCSGTLTGKPAKARKLRWERQTIFIKTTSAEIIILISNYVISNRFLIVSFEWFRHKNTKFGSILLFNLETLKPNSILYIMKCLSVLNPYLTFLGSIFFLILMIKVQHIVKVLLCCILSPLSIATSNKILDCFAVSFLNFVNDSFYWR